MERRWQLKQISAAVWILATEQREKEALCISLSISSPSLSLAPCTTSTFMSHSLYFFLLPPLHPSFFPLLHLLWTWGTQRLLAARQPSAAEV